MREATLRTGSPEDAEACGRVCYAAFRDIALAHGFPPDFPSEEAAVSRVRAFFSVPGTDCLVAEREGRVVGVAFLHDRRPVAAVGPVAVAPDAQDAGVGRALTEGLLERADRRGFPSVRLVQTAYHSRSLSLYVKLGFDVREPLSAVQGTPIGGAVPGREVRRAAEEDVEACDRVCRWVHGHDRGLELRHAVRRGSATVVVRGGAVVGYATAVGFWGHAVAEEEEDLRALIAAAPAFGGPGFLVPTRAGPLLRWCLERGLRVVQPLSLMTRGWYREPRGAYLPSIGY